MPSESSPDSTTANSLTPPTSAGSGRPSREASEPTEVFLNGKRISGPVFLNGTTTSGVSRPRRQHTGGAAAADVPPTIAEAVTGPGAAQVVNIRSDGEPRSRAPQQQLLEAPPYHVGTPRRSGGRHWPESEQDLQLRSKFSMSPAGKGKSRVRDRRIGPSSPKRHEDVGIAPKRSFSSFGFAWGARARREKLLQKLDLDPPTGATLSVDPGRHRATDLDGQSLKSHSGASALRRFLTPSRMRMRSAKFDAAFDGGGLARGPPAPSSPRSSLAGRPGVRAGAPSTWSGMPNMAGPRPDDATAGLIARATAMKKIGPEVNPTDWRAKLRRRTESRPPVETLGDRKGKAPTAAAESRTSSPVSFKGQAAVPPSPYRQRGAATSYSRSRPKQSTAQRARKQMSPTPIISLDPPREASIELLDQPTRTLLSGDTQARLLERAVQLCLENPGAAHGSGQCSSADGLFTKLAAPVSEAIGRRQERGASPPAHTFMPLAKASQRDDRRDRPDVELLREKSRGPVRAPRSSAIIDAPPPTLSRSFRTKLKELRLLSRPLYGPAVLPSARSHATASNTPTALKAKEAASTDDNAKWWTSLTVKNRKSVGDLRVTSHPRGAGIEDEVEMKGDFAPDSLPSSDSKSQRRGGRRLVRGRRSEDLLARTSPKLATENIAAQRSKSIDLIRSSETSKVVPIRPFGGVKKRPPIPHLCVHEATPSRETHECSASIPSPAIIKTPSPASQRSKARFMNARRHPWLRQLVLQPAPAALPPRHKHTLSSTGSTSSYQTIDEEEVQEEAGGEGILRAHQFATPPTQTKRSPRRSAKLPPPSTFSRPPHNKSLPIPPRPTRSRASTISSQDASPSEPSGGKIVGVGGRFGHAHGTEDVRSSSYSVATVATSILYQDQPQLAPLQPQTPRKGKAAARDSNVTSSGSGGGSSARASPYRSAARAVARNSPRTSRPRRGPVLARPPSAALPRPPFGASDLGRYRGISNHGVSPRKLIGRVQGNRLAHNVASWTELPDRSKQQGQEVDKATATGIGKTDEATETLSQLVESFDESLTPLTMTPSSMAGSPMRTIGSYRRQRWTSMDCNSISDQAFDSIREVEGGGGGGRSVWQRSRFNSGARSSIALSTVLSYASTEANSSFGDGEELQELIEGIMAGGDAGPDAVAGGVAQRAPPSPQRSPSLPTTLCWPEATSGGTRHDEDESRETSPGKHRRSKTDSSVPSHVQSPSAKPHRKQEVSDFTTSVPKPALEVAKGVSDTRKATLEVTPPATQDGPIFDRPMRSLRDPYPAFTFKDLPSRGLLEAFGLPPRPQDPRSQRPNAAETGAGRPPPPRFLLNDEPVFVVDTPDASPQLVSGGAGDKTSFSFPRPKTQSGRPSAAGVDGEDPFDGFDRIATNRW